MRAVLREAWVVLLMLAIALGGLHPHLATSSLQYWAVWLVACTLYLLIAYAWLRWRFSIPPVSEPRS